MSTIVNFRNILRFAIQNVGRLGDEHVALNKGEGQALVFSLAQTGYDPSVGKIVGQFADDKIMCYKGKPSTAKQLEIENTGRLEEMEELQAAIEKTPKDQLLRGELESLQLLYCDEDGNYLPLTIDDPVWVNHNGHQRTEATIKAMAYRLAGVPLNKELDVLPPNVDNLTAFEVEEMVFTDWNDRRKWSVRVNKVGSETTSPLTWRDELQEVLLTYKPGMRKADMMRECQMTAVNDGIKYHCIARLDAQYGKELSLIKRLTYRPEVGKTGLDAYPSDWIDIKRLTKNNCQEINRQTDPSIISAKVEEMVGDTRDNILKINPEMTPEQATERAMEDVKIPITEPISGRDLSELLRNFTTGKKNTKKEQGLPRAKQEVLQGTLAATTAGMVVDAIMDNNTDFSAGDIPTLECDKHLFNILKNGTEHLSVVRDILCTLKYVTDLTILDSLRDHVNTVEESTREEKESA